MRTKSRKLLMGLCIAPVALGLALGQQMPKTTTERVKGEATVKTERLTGTVTYVEGNRLVVKMANGDLRTFEPPDNRRFVIDGRELRTSELQVGTRLTATVTTTTTPVTERTTTVGSGKVWYVSGNTVILTLPNNENRMYKVQPSYRFNVNGQKASVSDLRKGMVVSAEKIVEEPKTDIATDVAVTGSAPPPPRTEVARTAPEPAPAPRPAAAAPAPTPAPTPAAPAPPAATEPKPAELPRTGSPIHLFGLAGLLSLGASRILRRLA